MGQHTQGSQQNVLNNSFNPVFARMEKWVWNP